MITKKDTLPVVAIFRSISGEVSNLITPLDIKPGWGIIATFIRLGLCDVNCCNCDSHYTWTNKNSENQTIEDIVEEVKKDNPEMIIITGGEPLIHADKVIELCKQLINNIPVMTINIYTSGTRDMTDFITKLRMITYNYCIIMDWKLSSVKANRNTLESNINLLGKSDYIKFVIADRDDFYEALKIIRERIKNNLVSKVISPCFPCSKEFMQNIVELMKKENLYGVIFQPQLHNIIWDGKTIGLGNEK